MRVHAPLAHSHVVDYIMCRRGDEEKHRGRVVGVSQFVGCAACGGVVEGAARVHQYVNKVHMCECVWYGEAFNGPERRVQMCSRENLNLKRLCGLRGSVRCRRRRGMHTVDHNHTKVGPPPHSTNVEIFLVMYVAEQAPRGGEGVRTCRVVKRKASPTTHAYVLTTLAHAHQPDRWVVVGCGGVRARVTDTPIGNTTH